MAKVLDTEIKIFFDLGSEEYCSSPKDDYEEKNEASTKSGVSALEAFSPDEYKGIMGFVNVKEEYCSLPEDGYERENFKLEAGTEPSLSQSVERNGLDKHLGPDEYEEVTTTKTEVVEESYDVHVMADIGFANVKEEYYSSPENGYNSENFQPEVGAKLSLNRSKDVPIYKTEITQEERSGSDAKLSGENQKGLDVPEGNGEKFHCEECGYVTSDRSNLIGHAAAHWDRPRQFKCRICGDSFRLSKQLREHITTHDISDRRKYFACPYCDNSYCRKPALNRHVYEKHKGSKRFKCDECGYTTPNGSLMKRHLTVRHAESERRFKCPYCAYSSRYKANLEKHLRIHANAKVFKCDGCEFASVDKSSLGRHRLVKHSVEPKKYVCNHCVYSTHIGKDLAKHIKRRHPKPYRFVLNVDV